MLRRGILEQRVILAVCLLNEHCWPSFTENQECPARLLHDGFGMVRSKQAYLMAFTVNNLPAPF